MERSNPIFGKEGGAFVLKAGPGSAGKRLDSFLTSQLPELTRSRIKRLIEEGHITSENGPLLKSGQKIREGELFEVTIPEPEPLDATPEALPLNILYEDSSIIIIDKPAGMVVHPAAGHFSGTLVNALLHHCKDLSGVGGKLRPGIVHRLDKDTSGVMMATKNDKAHHEMAAQFKKHTIKRKYSALVYGRLETEGSIDLPLGRDPKDRKKISVVGSGRNAITHWKVLRRYEGATLLELTLETGRTHQIRVHLAKKGNPVIGDPVYGNAKRVREIVSPIARSRVKLLGRQALHACLLGFNHPLTGEYMEFRSELPDDMSEIIQCLEEYVAKR